MKKQILLILLIAFLGSSITKAQDTPVPVYAEVGLGFGQTYFSDATKTKLANALSGSFNPGIVANVSMAFYYTPVKWSNLGIGMRIKGSFAGGEKGDFGDSYFFNYYNLGISIKYYLSSRFNRGFYSRTGLGFGQFSAKRANELNQTYIHQYGIGSTFSQGVGYSYPVRKSSIGLEVEFEGSSRTGTVNTLGDQKFGSSQIGLNLIYSF